MESLSSAEIRRRFLGFFENRRHTVVPSTPLVDNDPDLLFVVAGMQPFKPYFSGATKAPWERAVSVQKCLRTYDIENVGQTARHATFFQMCGNFSFGDYFKETAIPLAWELVTKPVSEGGFGLEKDRRWVTVFETDDEAYDIWRKAALVPPSASSDVAWTTILVDGCAGPCGPCSEIYYDRGVDYGKDGGPVVDEERYLEIWNLVFIQTLRGPSTGPGKSDYEILGELPTKNIDTGLGLGRLATILQNVDNLYEIDTTRMILYRASDLPGKPYGEQHRDDVSLRIVADHVRSSVMLIGDGVTPGNEGRGYVLRRLLRRVIRNMRMLGAQQPTMGELVDATIEAMGPQYPELITESSRIHEVAQAEERAFLSTLRTGTTLFESAAAEVRDAGGTELSGERAFQLHDTYGFPIDITLEMAAEQGLTVDEQGFRRLMGEQRARAKADAQARKTGTASLGGYREVAMRPANRVHRLRRGADVRAGARDLARRRAGAGSGGGRRGRDRPRPDALLRRGRRSARRPRRHPARERCLRRRARRAVAGARADRPPRAHSVRRSDARPRRAERGRRRPPAIDLPRAHRNPHGP